MAIPGSIVGVGKLITPGGQQGPKGDAGTAANVPLADITQNGLLRQNTGSATDFVDGTNNCQPIAPVIWSARLRSFNAIGNPNFEVNQRNPGTVISNPGSNVGIIDRWIALRNTATMALNWAQQSPQNPGTVPGTNFRISSSQIGATLSTAQATIAALEYSGISQFIEGSVARELVNDVTSISLLVLSSVAGLKFSISLRDSLSANSLVKLITIPNANVWTLIQLPNIPVFPSGGNFSILPGNLSYTLSITLAIGSTYIAPAADTWQTGNFLGAPGMDNFGSKPVNSSFFLGFIQHEPGAVCSTLMDKPFSQNYDECLRYYTKSYDYATVAGAVTGNGQVRFNLNAAQHPAVFHIPFKRRMAKPPTVIGYSGSSGVVNTVRDETAAVDRTISGSVGVGDAAFNGFTVASINASIWTGSLHYTADTGW